jgi:hypothetical protein
VISLNVLCAYRDHSYRWENVNYAQIDFHFVLIVINYRVLNVQIIITKKIPNVICVRTNIQIVKNVIA